LSEETLTECALYNIALAHSTGDILVDLATKPAESKHGADWEWWFVHDGEGLGFRIQAKRLFPNGCYKSLLKPGKDPYSQLDTLVTASAKEDLQPLYCFYNFSHSQGRFNVSNSCSHSYRVPSFWGCTLAFAAQVKDAQSNQLKALRPIMHPWHTLVCDAAASSVVDAANQFISDCGGTRAGGRPRDLPPRVARLIEFAERRRRAEPSTYLDDEFWHDENEVPEDLAGLLLVRDQR
jgi:hypothetical protein